MIEATRRRREATGIRLGQRGVVRGACSAILILFAPVLLAFVPAPADEESKPATDVAANLLRTDSPAPYVHRLTLYDHAGQAIDPADPEGKPYSPKMTCGKCHPYAEIAKGWHFNRPTLPAAQRSGGVAVSHAASARADESLGLGAELSHSKDRSELDSTSPDRPGEPWIYADTRLGMQIPLSLRGWPGTFLPEQVGLSAWQFTLHFGRHLCGGGFADPSASAEADAKNAGHGFVQPSEAENKRWAISGPLEIDCMLCHATMASSYDAGEIERQVERQNLRWAATAALGLGLIRGDAKSVSNEYDPDIPPAPDRTDLLLPRVQYEKSRFDGDNRVLFEIVRKPPSERCVYCHATRHVGDSSESTRFVERDIHLTSGLSCADCHRNGMDHQTQRGIEDRRLPALLARRDNLDRGPRMAPGPTAEESALFGEIASLATAASFSCAGCHSAIVPHDVTINSRLAAPHPRHAGIPPLHFEKLSCTACHSGPWPEYWTKPVQTALAHALGVSTKERKPDALPLLLEPIFRRGSESAARLSDDPIVPARVLWPAYWALRKGAQTTPLRIEAVERAAGRTLPKLRGASYEQSTAQLSDEQIEKVLVALQSKVAEGAEAVYLRADNVYSLNPNGGVTKRIADALARPYAWPLAHDVRPARRALGVTGCGDCHSNSSAIFAGQAASDAVSTSLAEMMSQRRMSEFSGNDPALTGVWNRLLGMRTIGKAVLLVAILLVATVVLGWFSGALTRVEVQPRRALGAGGGAERAALLMVLCGACVQGASSLLPARFEHWPLFIHSAANPIFIAGIVAWAILWKRSCAARATSRDWAICLTLCAGLGVMTMMLLAMLPLFGTDEMRALLAWHKYFGIAVLLGLMAVISLSLPNRAAAR